MSFVSRSLHAPLKERFPSDINPVQASRCLSAVRLKHRYTCNNWPLDSWLKHENSRTAAYANLQNTAHCDWVWARIQAWTASVELPESIVPNGKCRNPVHVSMWGLRGSNAFKRYLINQFCWHRELHVVSGHPTTWTGFNCSHYCQLQSWKVTPQVVVTWPGVSESYSGTTQFQFFCSETK